MRKTWLIFTQAVTVALAVLFVVATLKPEWLSKSGASVLDLPSSNRPSLVAPASGAATTSYASAARRATPTVVSITARTLPRRRALPDDPWFRFFFGDQAQEQQPGQVGLGSGVIVGSDGYLLTNNHVVAGADDIEVQLADGREAQARLVGTDPDTDLAVLKIALDHLPTVQFGDADALEVGDVVLAIGNPFGVGMTVTSGIVSALGRNQLGINTFENFIQTDAAINPGNSGGALINANGQLIGINSAIYSRSGGSMGIGFAIPVSTAKRVMEGLVRDGQVTRGWIGVDPRDLTAEIAQALNISVREGVLITGVLQSGPAGTAGLRPGDVVTRVGGKTVLNTRQLLDTVAALKPGTRTAVEVRRANQTLELQVAVVQRPRARKVDP